MSRYKAALTSAVALVAVGLVAMTPPTAAEAQTATRPVIPTIEQFAAFPAMNSFTVSQDGRHIAAVENRGDDHVILVWRTDNLSAAPTRIGSTNMQIRGVRFVKNDRLGVSMMQPYDADTGGSTARLFLNKFMITDLEGRYWYDPINAYDARSSSEEEALRAATPQVLDFLPNDPDNILIQIRGDVFRLNVHNNRSSRVQRSGETVVGYETDLNGDLRVRQIADRDSNGLYVATQIRSPQGSWEEHFRNYVRNREVFAIAGFTADPNIAFVLSNRGRDRAAIFEYNVATRQIGEIAFEHPMFEATGISIEDTRGDRFGQVNGFSYAGPRTTFYPAAPEWESLYAGIGQALGIEETPLTVVDPSDGRRRTIRYPSGKFFTIESASDDLNTVVLWAGSANDPGGYYLLKNKTELSLLSRPYPSIDPASLGTTELVYYKARDGLDIPAFLSKPSEALYGAGPYPTVIMPHGGPWSRDELDWDWSMWRQLLTSRGYAVLQPQFRGSDGWGSRLWLAGDNEWGQKMQDDKDDGAQWLIDTGVAQQGRVAMYGFSYGGYSAFAASVRPRGLYKCAIAGAGVSDLTRIRSSMFDNPYTREAQRDTVNGLNPVTQAGQMQIPLMVFTGVRDRIVLQEQSDVFVSRARGSGQPLEYYVIDNYAHGPYWTTAINAEVLGHIDTYLREGCGGGGL